MIITTATTKIISILIITASLISSVKSQSRHPLYDGRRISWNMTDSAFTPKTGANYRINLGDTLDVLCPSNNFRRSASEPAHKFNIHMVDYLTYKTCNFNTETNQRSSHKIIYRCNNPDRVKMMSLNILQVSPFIDAVTFHPDQSYYFVTGDAKLCEKGLKMRIRVVEDNNKNVVRLEKTPQLQFSEDDEYYQEQNNDYEGINLVSTTKSNFATSENQNNNDNNNFDDFETIERPDLIDEISEFFNGDNDDNSNESDLEQKSVFQLSTEKIIGIAIIFLILIFIITFLLYLLICKKTDNNSDQNPFHYSQTMQTNFDYKPNLAGGITGHGHHTILPNNHHLNNNHHSSQEILPFTLKLPPLENQTIINSQHHMRQPQTYQAYFNHSTNNQNENSNNNVHLNVSRSPNSQNTDQTNSGSTSQDNLNITDPKIIPVQQTDNVVQINLNPASSLPSVTVPLLNNKKSSSSSNNDNSNYSISSGYNSDFMRNCQKSPEKGVNSQSLSPQRVPHQFLQQQQQQSNSKKNSIDILQFNQPWKSLENQNNNNIKTQSSSDNNLRNPPLDEVIVQNGQYIVAI